MVGDLEPAVAVWRRPPSFSSSKGINTTRDGAFAVSIAKAGIPDNGAPGLGVHRLEYEHLAPWATAHELLVGEALAYDPERHLLEASSMAGREVLEPGEAGGVEGPADWQTTWLPHQRPPTNLSSLPTCSRVERLHHISARSSAR